jgi:Tol biopolymer transport system component
VGADIPLRAALILVLAASCGGDRASYVAGVEPDAVAGRDSDDSAVDESDGAQDWASGQTPEDGTTDSALPACDRNAPFGPPTLLPGANLNTAVEQGGPRLTADELTLYFSSRRRPSNVSDLFVAHRSSRMAAFDPAVPLTALDSDYDEFDPTTITELSIFFTSDRPTGLGGIDLWVATRSSTASDFNIPTDVQAPLNSTSNDAQPFLRADGTELWFASDRAGGQYQIYRAPQAGALFGAPELVAELSAPAANDITPTLSADGLVVFFASNRTDGGALGGFDVWTASRPDVTAPFSNVYDVSVLNSSDDDFPGWLSVDGCRLYMSRNHSGSEVIYVATRG